MEDQQKKFPVYCPWCEVNKGRTTIVAYSTIENSSGICDECDEELRREAGLPPKKKTF